MRCRSIAVATGNFPKVSGRVALLLAAALGLLLIWQLVQMFWLVVVGPDVESAPVPPVPRVQTASVGRDGFRWDLFGETRAAPVVVAPVRASRSDLRLRGLMSGGKDAFAIIADEQGRERIYRVGDELPDGSRLERIEPLRVLLGRNGDREALELPRERTGSLLSERSGPRHAASSPPRLPGIRGFEAPSGVSAASVQRPESAVSGLADQISILPVSGGGFRVRPGRDATLFAELGLQVNDVVTAVNGQPLHSEEDARALFAEVMRRGEVSITIQREGREITLRPDLAQILSRIQ